KSSCTACSTFSQERKSCLFASRYQMKFRPLGPLCPAIIGLVLGSLSHGFAQAEIVLISPASIRPALEQVLPGFERKTGHTVKVTFGNGGRNKQQVALGEVAFDVSILQPPYPEVLASGNVVSSSATPL